MTKLTGIDFKSTTKAFACALLLVTAACGSSDKGSLGSVIEDDAKRLEKIAENWKDGKDDVEDGRKLVEKGRDQIADNRDEVRDESRELEKQKRELSRAQEAYEAALMLSSASASRQGAYGTPTTGTAIEEVEAEDETLKRLQKQVEKIDEKIEDTRKDIEKAKDKIRDGEKRVRKGEDMIKKGERAMLEAEAEYRASGGADDGFFDSLF